MKKMTRSHFDFNVLKLGYSSLNYLSDPFQATFLTESQPADGHDPSAVPQALGEASLQVGVVGW